MHSSFDIWKILAGVAIFLLGMSFLENSLKQLAGRRFKLFLRKQTSSKFKAITGGAVVTGVLQSSSVVSLTVLAFVGANVISMQNALAVILGANFGTTLDSWIVATVGFKLNIESIAFPITGIAGISLAISKKETPWYNWSYFLLGFGFLFVGLSFMKTGIEDAVKNIDLQTFNQYPAIVFVGLGFILTSLIQSSSATIAITLSALFVHAISFPQATAIVLGSEVGTTVKLLLASAGGNAAKKRVATGNFLFNIVTITIVFIILTPINQLIKNTIGIKDDLIALVFFQSLINILSIVLFLPFLKPLGHFLEKRFTKANKSTLFIHKTPVADFDLAIDALGQETKHFAIVVIDFCLDCFDVQNRPARNLAGKNIQEKYEHLKYLHGEMHSYYVQLQKTTTGNEDIELLDRYISSVRNCMYAAKSLKDSYNDVRQLRNSSNDAKYSFYLQTRENIEKFCSRLSGLLQKEDSQSCLDELISIYRSTTGGYTDTLQQLYREGMDKKVNEIEITTLINFNREVFTAFKALIFGAKDYLLEQKQSAYFDELPGFIR